MLSANFAVLSEELKSIEAAGADLLHIDIMDGHFVPNLTFGAPIVKAIRPYTKLPFDVHLMVTNPGDYVEEFAKIGVEYFTFHQETCGFGFFKHIIIGNDRFQHFCVAFIYKLPGTIIEKHHFFTVFG